MIPIPLGAQSGEKNVRGKIKLDLRQFQLKQGQQLQYMVRVYDSHRRRSNGQSYGDASKSAESKANGQESNKNQASNATRPASHPATAADSAKKSSSGRVAQTGKPRRLRNLQKLETADAADRKQHSPNNPHRDTAKSAASKTPSSQSQQASTAKKTATRDKNQGGMTGAAPDSMPRRQLDVNSQSAASSTMKIHIDQFAGSFEGQQRQKLELAINPVLKELDAALAKAIEELRPISDAFSEGGNRQQGVQEITAGRRHPNCTRPIAGGRPGPKIGRNALRIHRLAVGRHHRVARFPRTSRCEGREVGFARAKRAGAAGRGAFDPRREMLADLTRKYENVKRNLRLADDMQRIKKMYQVFLENTMAFLAANRGTLNPRNRKMAELELDEEFFKQYRELQQEWEKTLAELAKVLAKDPRLLARYMSLSRRRVDTLRDQLTLLNLRQQELLVPVKQMSGEAPRSGCRPKARRKRADKRPWPKEQIAAGIRAVQATLAHVIWARLPRRQSLFRRTSAPGCRKR